MAVQGVEVDSLREERGDLGQGEGVIIADTLGVQGVEVDSLTLEKKEETMNRGDNAGLLILVRQAAH